MIWLVIKLQSLHYYKKWDKVIAGELTKARLAQLVERKALNLVVVGSSPTVGDFFLYRVFFPFWSLVAWAHVKKPINLPSPNPNVAHKQFWTNLFLWVLWTMSCSWAINVLHLKCDYSPLSNTFLGFIYFWVHFQLSFVYSVVIFTVS